MNICVVSTFDGTTEDYMGMWNSLEGERSKIISDYDIGVVRDGKIILTMNVIDMDLLQEVMTSEDMKAWDKKHNCVDVIYSLEEQGQFFREANCRHGCIRNRDSNISTR